MKIYFAILLTVFGLTIPFAAAARECQLAMDSTTLDKSEKVRLAYLRTITKDEWEKKTVDGTLDTDFFGFGMDISGDGTYNYFNEIRNKYLDERRFTDNSERSSNYLKQNLGDNALAAYRACIKSDFLYGYVESLTDSTATVKIAYSPPAEGVDVELKVQYLSEGAGDIKQIEDDLSPLGVGAVSITLDRNIMEDLIFTVNSVSGFLGTVNIAIIKEPIPTAPPVVQPVFIQAKDFVRGTHVAIDQCTPGPGILANALPCHARANAAEFDFVSKSAGDFLLSIYYTAEASRPVKLTLNGKVIRDQALSEVSGSWSNNGLKWFDIGVFPLVQGSNTIRMERGDVFPHIKSLRFVPNK